MSNRLNTVETVLVDGEAITGRVYHVRDNGWACVESDTGRVASGPTPDREIDILDDHATVTRILENRRTIENLERFCGMADEYEYGHRAFSQSSGHGLTFEEFKAAMDDDSFDVLPRWNEA